MSGTIVCILRLICLGSFGEGKIVLGILYKIYVKNRSNSLFLRGWSLEFTKYYLLLHKQIRDKLITSY